LLYLSWYLFCPEKKNKKNPFKKPTKRLEENQVVWKCVKMVMVWNNDGNNGIIINIKQCVTIIYHGVMVYWGKNALVKILIQNEKIGQFFGFFWFFWFFGFFGFFWFFQLTKLIPMMGWLIELANKIVIDWIVMLEIRTKLHQMVILGAKLLQKKIKFCADFCRIPAWQFWFCRLNKDTLMINRVNKVTI